MHLGIGLFDYNVYYKIIIDINFFSRNTFSGCLEGQWNKSIITYNFLIKLLWFGIKLYLFAHYVCYFNSVWIYLVRPLNEVYYCKFRRYLCKCPHSYYKCPFHVCKLLQESTPQHPKHSNFLSPANGYYFRILFLRILAIPCLWYFLDCFRWIAI